MSKYKTGFLSIICAAVFLIIVCVSALAERIPPIIPVIYIVTSLITFIMYFFDKSAARKGTWRTRESTLHTLSLVGGWPGAVVARQMFRHKTTKKSFRCFFWITIFLNCSVLVWLFMPAGAATLQSLFDILV
ncbi:MAG: DUF1294 domain-containing protein [Planctomycetes bacterium]|nr:DUF1294 domain-containing protein [Planctomycetota bacterium]